MDKLTIILCLSAVIWFILDRAKYLWSNCKYGKWVTFGSSLVLSCVSAFLLNLDLLNALSIISEITVIGKIFTALAISSGSSVVAELITFVKNFKK